MQLKILGVGNAPLLSVKVKTLDDAEGLLNVSALARALGVHRSTFLSRVATHGLEAAILYYATEQKLKNVS
ncbi:TPA: helix-turn-helix domain-containing protein [Klebsiella pneumoniae]|uniref:helix-turn-helix domain-containing protein n=1 Tax=Klebsiella/Raoultella group TaxID=2890311 RepID=UPI00163A5A3D|nr:MULTISPECIES: helix-turn-helix domain-containing protein [Klebsiella/Raoultella group]MBK1538522.1 helix-turn-helix domain-containing protein [Klebsiella pneumoniae]MDP0692049.1 helix-turn-helix domain-containing protein [Klebsiella pneumoniae]MDP0773669.1 helix-turn-helix domain-containing protein [Klebsiella pneumoniae]MDW1272379.1 helix-turn-helix domain-containing protein [Klebsiella pneumoniae]WKF92152.1 helix-turn-helix domain-containing protein [Klebsiella pneumoniae]